MQPLLVNCSIGQVSICHNGNLISAQATRTEYEAHGHIFLTTSDTEVVLHMLANNKLFEHSTVTIYDAVDQGLAVDPESFRAGISEQSFRHEFLCEYVDETTAFLTYEMIAECEDPKLTRARDVEEHRRFTDPPYAG